MCDLFSSHDARRVFQNKRVLFLGDSNVRSFYKDTVFLLENNRLLSLNSLKNKLGSVVPHDKIISNSRLHRGRDYYEVREYKNRNVHFTFHFLTKCFTEVIRDMFHAFKKNKAYPDIIIMNSCLWDICRWGPNGVLDYKDNVVKLMKLVKSCLPEETLFIWTCVPPISNRCRGGLLVKQVQFLEHSVRFDVMEGNMFAREVVVSHGFDVLDIHYYLRMQLHWRAEDGVHWLPHAVRHVTNLILTHICVAFNLKLPGNNKGESVERFKSSAVEIKSKTQKVELPNLRSAVTKIESKKPKILQTRQLSNLREEKVVLSPLRKTIKDKIKRVKRETDEYSEGDSFSNLSILSNLSDDGNTSYVSDISFEASTENQYQGLGMSFEPVSYNMNSLMNSPIPNFREHEKRDLKGPIRFRAVHRWNRTHRAPYTYR